MADVRAELVAIREQFGSIFSEAASLLKMSRDIDRLPRSNADFITRSINGRIAGDGRLELLLEVLEDRKKRVCRSLELWVDISFSDDTGDDLRGRLFPKEGGASASIAGGSVTWRAQELYSAVKHLLEEVDYVDGRMKYFSESRAKLPPPAAEKVTLAASPVREQLFIACSRQNAKWLERLKMHLVTFVRKDVLDVWDETHIEAGTMWRDEIAAAVSRSSLAVLLISVEFIASDLIASNVLPPILHAQSDRGLVVVPVFVSPCTLPDELSAFQGLNTLERSLEALPLVDADIVFLQLVDLIKKRQSGGA
ncbi:toll/interleukin-1 receptor domain-containing protein [Sorangium sp. So ce1151]|uniref:toll/interleukin-1 receptor domain-containing protein n=1 Tax=Sorangium sp. So ce1151 TaxID=3133332 RepID=UPI003F60180C